ncbi:uncharacterized protein K444DRAFT_516123, partial [Hyaloscypha bicolor E]
IEKLFSSYLWKFILVYINNIIIFLKNIKTYINYLFSILRILLYSGITLNLLKYYFI